MVSSTLIGSPDSLVNDREVAAATVHPLLPRDHQAEAPWIAVVDSRPCRREFIAKFLDARECLDGRIVSLGLDDLCREQPSALGVPSMVVFSVGGMSLTDPRMAADFERVLGRFDGVPVVVLSDLDAPDEAQLALVAGAHGFVPTLLQPPLLCAALALVQAGGKFAPPDRLDDWVHAIGHNRVAAEEEMPDDPVPQYEELSPRQTHVLLLLQEGLANKVIATRLGMTESTVKVHVRQIMRRLGANNRTEAALLAQRHQQAVKRRAS